VLSYLSIIPPRPLCDIFFEENAEDTSGACTREGDMCRHSYYAFGLGASSYLQGTRFTRPRRLKQWEEYVDKLGGQNHPSDVLQAGTTASESSVSVDRLLDAIMLGLRLQQGIDLQWLHRHFGQVRVRQILKAMENGRHVADGRAEVVGDGRMLSCEEALSMLDSKSEGALPEQLAVRLTDPCGLLTSNDIISDVFLQIDNVATNKQAAG
jgi:hypothetical protein